MGNGSGLSRFSRLVAEGPESLEEDLAPRVGQFTLRIACLEEHGRS